MHHDLAVRTLPTLISTINQRLGVELPKELQEVVASTSILRNAGREGFLEAPALASAVAAALQAKKNPLDSKDVQRAMLAHQLHAANIGNRVSEHATERVALAFVDHADAIIESWRPIVSQADEALRTFREAAPGADLQDQASVTSLPSHALTPWGRAREAVAQLEQLGKAWVALAQASGSLSVRWRPLGLAALTLEQLEQFGNTPVFTDATRLDVRLDLASLQDYAERAEQIEQERNSREDYAARAPERARAERRKLLGVAMRIPGGAA